VDHPHVVGIEARERVLVAGGHGTNRRAQRGGPRRDRQEVTGGENAANLEHMLHSRSVTEGDGMGPGRCYPHLVPVY
jgi:hypothetical protein